MALAACATDSRREPAHAEPYALKPPATFAAARTRPEHERAASWYEREALAARESAAEHRRMAERYALSRSGAIDAAAIEHCGALARRADEVAETIRAVALLHRGFAADAAE